MTAMPSDSSPLRHRRVWLRPSRQGQDVVCGDRRAIEAIVAWQSEGLPFVGRAVGAGDPEGHVPLGLALMVDGCRARLAFSIEQQSVARIEDPIALGQLLPSLPGRMRDTARRLNAAARELGMPLGAYGSVAWEHCKAGYLHAASDLDLLARPANAESAKQWLQVLGAIDAAAPMRIDGEIELPDGYCVAWRELAQDGARMLTKSDRGPQLRSREQVWSTWPTERSAC